jgi:hypothetical protein
MRASLACLRPALLLALASCGDAGGPSLRDADPLAPDADPLAPDASPYGPDSTPSTCGVCHHGDGCCPGGCDRGGDSDCPAPLGPRLVVADESGRVGIWDHADVLTNREADVLLVGPDGSLDGVPRGLAVHDNRLIVISDGAERPIAVYDDAWNATAGGLPDRRISIDDVGTRLGALHTSVADPAGNLWLLEATGRIVLVKGGALGTATGAAQFTHPWGQVESMTVAGDKLFAGQISGAGVLVWNDPLARSGAVSGADWTLSRDVASWAMTAGADRLYALASAGQETHLVAWSRLGELTAPRTPDLELVLSADSAVGDLAWHDGSLVAVIANGVDQNRVAIYDGASLGPGSAPGAEIRPGAADYLETSHLDRHGNLYVLDTDGVYVYRDALGTPTLAAKLTTFSRPTDFAVLE